MIRNLIIVLIIIGPGLAFGFFGKPTEMGLAIVAGAIAAAFINIDKIQKFKGAGFEAEMRRVVDEAYATTENLKEMTVPLVWSTMNMLNHLNRWGSIDFVEKNEMKDHIKSVVENFEIKDKRIMDTFDKFQRFHTWDLYQKFTSTYIRETKQDDLHLLVNEIRDINTIQYPSKEKIIKTLKIDETKLSQDLKNYLEDYVYYVKTGKLRRKDIKDDE